MWMLKLSSPGAREGEGRGQSMHEGMDMMGYAGSGNCCVISRVCYKYVNVLGTFFIGPW